jgi:formylglycine-generating enzyme required for sulfatase activity
VYSLGASAFELLTGRLPFAGLPPAIIAGHLFTEPTIPETLPTSWQEVLRRCLIKDHSQRWSAKELVDNLKSQFTGNLFVEPATGMRFLWVPGGRFQIGADNIQFPSAFDPRWVDVSPFWMAETPVTNEQYRRFVEAERHSEPGYWNNDRFNAPSQPVVSVRWNDAVAFCRWLTKQNGFEVRLPSEIEWEFAARGTDGRKYPWGNEEPDDTRACFNQDWNIGRPAAVGSYPAGRGPFGHLDLAGNVWEWCQEDVTKDFRQSDIVRALRGGSWFDDPRSLLSAYRSRLPAGLRFRSVGFRVAAASTVEH